MISIADHPFTIKTQYQYTTSQEIFKKAKKSLV